MVAKSMFLMVLIFLMPPLNLTRSSCDYGRSCKLSRIHGMQSADCYNRDLRRFPRCLKSDVEIIDVSYNRLRHISESDMSLYPKLKFLYLSDNMISKIEENAFSDNSELQSLDMSINALSTVPSSIFQLPSLKRLYLSQNQNINIVEVIEKAKPLTSPLEYLDIGFNELDTLPDLGLMPHLLLYNISGNELLHMAPKHVAGLCNLKELVNNNFSASFEDPCDCWKLERWLRERNVKFVTLNCSDKLTECSAINLEDVETLEECEKLRQDIIFRSRIKKILIIGSVLLLLLILCVVYFVIRTRRKHKKSKSPHGAVTSNGQREGRLLL